MDVFRAKDFADLITFRHHEGQLAVLGRQPLNGGDEFFQKLAGIPLNVIGMVGKTTGLEAILSLLEDEITEDLKSTPFYIEWVKDLADVCNVFCDILESRFLCHKRMITLTIDDLVPHFLPSHTFIKEFL